MCFSDENKQRYLQEKKIHKDGVRLLFCKFKRSPLPPHSSPKFYPKKRSSQERVGWATRYEEFKEGSFRKRTR